MAQDSLTRDIMSRESALWHAAQEHRLDAFRALLAPDTEFKAPAPLTR